MHQGTTQNGINPSKIRNRLRCTFTFVNKEGRDYLVERKLLVSKSRLQILISRKCVYWKKNTGSTKLMY